MTTSRRVRSVRTRSSRGRSNLLWQTASVNPTTLGAGSSTTVNLLPNVPDLDLGQATVMRIRGQWGYHPDNSDLDHHVVIGIYVLPDESFVAGATLEPEADLGSYLWVDSAWMRLGDIIGGGSQQWVQREVDAKSKRRIRAPENSLVITVENTLSASLTFAFFLRVLLKMA